MKKLLFLLFIEICIIFGNAQAKTAYPDVIRIGLSYGSSALSSFTLSADSGIRISDIGKMTGQVTFKKNGSKKLEISNGSKTKTCSVDDEYGVSVSPVDDDEYISFNGKEYRGDFVIFRFSDSDITVINVLDLEEYLYGVVPKEIATGHPIEALKAQAVAARTYAIKSVDKYKKWNFDMTYTTADQAYGGVDSEKEDTTKAVKVTKGEIVTYEGEPITTYYFSTSAGFTENSENVWVTAYPYLVAVEDKYQSENVTYANWEVTFTAKELKSILENKDKKIGNITGLNILKESPSNGVLELEFVGTKDTYSVTKATTKSVFGTSDVRSQFYDIITDNAVTSVNVHGETATLPVSEMMVISGKKGSKFSATLDDVTVLGKKKEETYNMIPTKYTLTGKGYGHGVGMSQNGAIGMAKAGFKYDEILKWYYTGIEVEEL